VPVERLFGLKLTAPPGEGTRYGVHVALMSVEGWPLAEGQATLVVMSTARLFSSDGDSLAVRASGFEATCPEVAGSQQFNAGPKPFEPVPEQERRWRAEILMHAGDKKLAEGNVAAARAFYKRAAELGSSPAAVALGATYDPEEAPRAPLLGIGTDAHKAQCWYAKARQLADMEVASQVKN
jgi:TPR repeat protein